MSSLAAFAEQGLLTRRVTREVDSETFDGLAGRIADGLEWGVGALVEADGRALFVYEDDIWKLPGGGVEPGEDRQDALEREVREETGVGIVDPELAAVSEVTVTHEGARATFRFGTYRADPVDTTTTADPGLPGEAIERVAWHESTPENCLDSDLLARLR